MESRVKCGKMAVFSVLKQGIFQFVPDTLRHLLSTFSNQAHPSSHKKHQESSKNYFGQIFISSFAFNPLRILGKVLNVVVKAVLKLSVQFRLIASLTARAHGKCVLCPKACGSCNQLQSNRINYQFN